MVSRHRRPGAGVGSWLTGTVPAVPDVDALLRRARGSRLADAARALRASPQAAAGLADPPQDYTEWLRACTTADLETADARAAHDLDYTAFAALDDDVWAMLLSQDHTAYPGLKAFLPAVPDPALQELWNGASGARLANQTKTFVAKVRERFAEHGAVALTAATVLDHGVGWGRIIRHFARFVPVERLHGTDPAAMILNVCRRDRVPATLHQTAFLPESLPVSDVDLAYCFSVFTHLSERAADVNLDALHAAMVPGAILVATIRPPAYADLVDGLRRPRGAEHVFLPHPAEPSHHQWDGGEMTYGEAIIAVDHVREHWAPRFTLLDATPLVGDLHQVVLTLRRT